MVVAQWVALVAALSMIPAAVITAQTWRAARCHWMGSTYLRQTGFIMLSLGLDALAWATGRPVWLVVDLVVVRALAALVTPSVTLVYWQGVKRGGQVASQ